LGGTESGSSEHGYDGGIFFSVPRKPWAEPVLNKKVVSIEKEDQFDDIFEGVASGSLYSEGSWDESESSSELLAELEALE